MLVAAGCPETVSGGTLPGDRETSQEPVFMVAARRLPPVFCRVIIVIC